MDDPRDSLDPGQWADCPIEVASFLYFDIETSGLRPDRGARILEIAVLGSSDIDCHWVRENVDHGDDSVVNQLPDLLDVLTQGIVVGHNVGFDLRFVAYEADRLGYSGPEVRYIDTLALARRLVQDDDFRLGALAARFDIDVEGKPHTAVGDARMTRELFWMLVDTGDLKTPSEAGMKPLNWTTF